jgi:glycosyltransferase involved in cell wall biosynthesis
MALNKQLLRVAMVGNYPLDTTRIRGGVQAAFAYLVKGLAKLEGLDLHLLTFRQPGFEGMERIEQNGLTIHLMPLYPRFERLRNYRNLQSLLNRELSKLQPDIVHAEEASADAYVALRSGYPTVVTVHGIRFEDSKYYSSWGQRMRLYLDGVLIERQVIRRTRYLISISQYVMNYFSNYFRADLRSYTIPNPIDERYFHLQDKSAGPVVLFAGRLTPLKKVLDLIKAFETVVQHFPKAQLRLAGECSSEPAYVEAMKVWIQQKNLRENIYLLGPLSEPDIMQEFSRCSVLALPSSQEIAPMVIAQAMAAGKPVVATRVGGVAEMVGDAGERGYLVEVGDIGALAAAIQRILGSPALRARLGQAGQEFARQHYSNDCVARRTFEVYQSVAAAERSQHA